MLIVNIGGKDYTLEYTIEASLHKDCVDKMTNYMKNVIMAQANGTLENLLSNMSDLPHIALSSFYAGLLEHHSDEIRSEKDAKNLIKTYFSEHKEDGKDNFYEVMEMISGCMNDDGFFRQIGLEQFLQKLMEQTEEEQIEKKEPKKPQDHKKKATKVSEK